MRRGLCALAVVAALALAGCVGFTDPATHVTQTSAWLEAHGRSDDYPASFHFRYANQQADLPTAAAKRTPTKTVPAHTPASGNYAYFHEGAPDLSPGRVYFFELCGSDVRPGAQEMCGGVRKFFTEPSSAQDFVQATLPDPSAPFYSYSVRAASGPTGQNPDGLASFRYKDFFDGEARVTCLRVETVNFTVRAAIGVVGTRGQAFGGSPQPYSALYTVSKTLFEPNRFQIREQSSPDCEHADFSNQFEFNFDLTIRDAN
jgi:hypothetical protein